MTDKTGDLFPEVARPRGRTNAPDELPPHDLRALHAWAEQKVPWISRSALDSYTTLEDHVEEVLEWWQAAGRQRKDWRKTIQNRIRKVERARLTRMARQGSDEAKLALLKPAEWARRYDRKARAAETVRTATGGEGLIRPSGGTVIRLTPGGRK